MTDEQILNSILQDIDDMSDEELIKALRDTPDIGLGEVLGDPFELVRDEED